MRHVALTLGCSVVLVSGLAVAQQHNMRRDNQDENPATIRMRMRRCWGDEGRA